MGIQSSLGKAFEFACLNSLKKSLIMTQPVFIEQTRALFTAKDNYDTANEIMKEKMDKGADAATRVILKLEPQLVYPQNNKPLFLSIQEDAAGIRGDVRDILCIRKQNGWEIGLSCKHNHTAVKHSRLSGNIDFGSMWFDIPCSQEYFDNISPLFQELKELKEGKIRWRELDNKATRFYKPILKEFINEIISLDNANPGIIPQKLLQYLIGNNDFYKVITIDSRRVTQVMAYNLYGTLNKRSGKERSLVGIPQLSLPTRFFDISFKPGSENTIIIACDNGWTVSMRIHNASSIVEPSLKFDIQLKGVPQELHSHHESWD